MTKHIYTHTSCQAVITSEEDRHEKNAILRKQIRLHEYTTQPPLSCVCLCRCVGWIINKKSAAECKGDGGGDDGAHASLSDLERPHTHAHTHKLCHPGGPRSERETQTDWVSYICKSAWMYILKTQDQKKGQISQIWYAAWYHVTRKSVCSGCSPRDPGCYKVLACAKKIKWVREVIGLTGAGRTSISMYIFIVICVIKLSRQKAYFEKNSRVWFIDQYGVSTPKSRYLTG